MCGMDLPDKIFFLELKSYLMERTNEQCYRYNMDGRRSDQVYTAYLEVLTYFSPMFQNL